MQFASKSKPSESLLAKDDKVPRLNLYLDAPRGDVSLEEFTEIAVTRFNVLRKIEDLSLTQTAAEDKNVKLTQAVKDMPIYTSIAARRDHISHFILRLAFAENEELRRWFLAQECALLQHRMKGAASAVNRLFADNQDCFPFRKAEVPVELAGLVPSSTRHHYQVPFQDCLDLVARREVPLYMGYAYIPEEAIGSLVMSIFRKNLSRALAVTSRKLFQIEQDERLARILKALRSKHVGQDFKMSSLAGSISLDQIDVLADESFPPCMLRLHHALRANHHLRHGGRMQYGLFLKGVGLTLEQSLAFWKSEFTKKMDADKFEKSYAYNVRHNYGREGKRANYTPYSCMKVILSNPPAAGDHHGCFFRHSDPKWLKQHLTDQVGLSLGMANEIAQLAENQHYQLACRSYFNARHPGQQQPGDPSVNHPNQYFIESRDILAPSASKPSVQYEEQQ